jgi:hypothetical protein
MTLRTRIDSLLRQAYARYKIVDDYGTFQLAWTFTEARAWLPVCGPTAVIFDRYRNRAAAARTYHKSSAD